MRGTWLLLLVAACARHFDRNANSGLDGERWGAHKLDLSRGEAHVRGTVSAPGGDGTDWLAFELPANACNNDLDVDVALHYKTPRPHMRIALSIFDEAHRTSWMISASSRRAYHSQLPPGRYFARVTARDDAAAAYAIDIAARPAWCEPPAAPPVHVRRPPTYQPPALPRSLDHEVLDVVEVGISTGRGGRGFAIIDPGTTAVAVGWTGTLVDGRGTPVPRGQITITDLGPAAAVASLADPNAIISAAQRGDEVWTAVVEPPPPVRTVHGNHPAIDAALTRVETKPSGEVVLTFDRGSADGVVAGSYGELVHASGVLVPNGSFVIVRVEPHRAFAAAWLVLADKDHLRAHISAKP